MIKTTRYSQRDPRWRNVKQGFSDTLTIGGFGCVITSLAMLLSAYGYTDNPDQVNTKLKDANAFSGALLIWSRVQYAYPRIKFIKLTNEYNNIDVAFNVYAMGRPVIVKVNGTKIGSKDHWVLFVGYRKMIDPWDGAIKPTSHYLPLKKYALYGRA